MLPFWFMAFIGIVMTVVSKPAFSDTVCQGAALGSPVARDLQVFSKFNPPLHYGVDYVARGDTALATEAGEVKTIGWDSKTLLTPNERSHLKVQGWGRYVILSHADGSQTLYAHLEKDSTQQLKVGQSIKKGEALGKTDSTGGVTGPHLHFEYSPTGNIFKKSAKVDPDLCVLRVDWFSLESYPFDVVSVGQLYVDGQLIGENLPNQKKRFVLQLKPGQHLVRIVAKQVSHDRTAYFSTEMGRAFTIVNTQGADLGPGFVEKLKQGKEFSAILKVE